MEEETTFRLSEAAWKAAARELASIGGEEPDEEDRRWIEYRCRPVLWPMDRVPISGLAEARLLERYAKALELADKLASEIDSSGMAFEASMRCYTTADTAYFRVNVPVFARGAQQWAAGERAKREWARGNRPRRWPAHHPMLSIVAESLIEFWIYWGAKKGSVTPGGPLVRFLGATLGEALVAGGAKKPSMAALREIARKAVIFPEPLRRDDDDE